MDKYICYASETTGACFAIDCLEGHEHLLKNSEYFVRTKEQCEQYHIHSRIKGFLFNWEK